MQSREELPHSILLVSASEQFDAIVKRSLKGFITLDTKKSGASARRGILERYYDLVLINAPLPDEAGEELALFSVENTGAGCLITVPREIYEESCERLIDHGIFVLAKPFQRGSMDKLIRFLSASQSRIHRLEQKILTMEEKAEELKLVSTAKLLLIQKKQLTEDEAHRYIGRLAMQQKRAKRDIAESIIRTYSQ